MDFCILANVGYWGQNKKYLNEQVVYEAHLQAHVWRKTVINIEYFHHL